MADTTIVNTPAAQGDTGSEAVIGWTIAAIILAAAIIGGILLLRRTPVTPTPTPGTNVQVTLPSGTGSTGGSTGY